MNCLGGEQSNDLLKVALDIISSTQCNQMYGTSKRLRFGIIESQICAGYLAGGKDTCQVNYTYIFLLKVNVAKLINFFLFRAILVDQFK